MRARCVRSSIWIDAASDTDRARGILCGSAMVSARDSVDAAVMFNHGVEWIATFDRGFDRIEGIRRVRLP